MAKYVEWPLARRRQVFLARGVDKCIKEFEQLGYVVSSSYGTPKSVKAADIKSIQAASAFTFFLGNPNAELRRR